MVRQALEIASSNWARGICNCLKVQVDVTTCWQSQKPTGTTWVQNHISQLACSVSAAGRKNIACLRPVGRGAPAEPVASLYEVATQVAQTQVFGMLCRGLSQSNHGVVSLKMHQNSCSICTKLVLTSVSTLSIRTAGCFFVLPWSSVLKQITVMCFPWVESCTYRRKVEFDFPSLVKPWPLSMKPYSSINTSLKANCSKMQKNHSKHTNLASYLWGSFSLGTGGITYPFH